MDAEHTLNRQARLAQSGGSAALGEIEEGEEPSPQVVTPPKGAQPAILADPPSVAEPANAGGHHRDPPEDGGGRRGSDHISEKLEPFPKGDPATALDLPPEDPELPEPPNEEVLHQPYLVQCMYS